MGAQAIPALLPTQQRRAGNDIKMLSHTAIRVRDLGKTREFYEDVLRLPLVSTQVITLEPTTQEQTNYAHIFFELADGSTIAFFQFEDGIRAEMAPHVSDAFERHLALRVNTEEDVLKVYQRYQDLGLETFTVDHDWCFSVYTLDPDGDTIEVTYHRPSADQVLAMPDARALLDEWLAKLKQPKAQN